MGLTYILDIFRAPETSVIADLEAAIGPEILPLRAYGPYRSEYGRLGEFPNLPPLLVRNAERKDAYRCRLNQTYVRDAEKTRKNWLG